MNRGNFQHRLRELGIKIKRVAKGTLYNLAPCAANEAAGAEEMN